MADNKTLLIGLVGPCKSGKTTLKRLLEKQGLKVRHIAQEHSFVPDMWQKIAKPELLIYLKVSYPTTLARSSLNWNKSAYEEQIRRLSHAYQHADLIIDTDPLNPEQIAAQVIEFLEQRKS
jgi:deoxyadenosine/deoxycytidine kinase